MPTADDDQPLDGIEFECLAPREPGSLLCALDQWAWRLIIAAVIILSVSFLPQQRFMPGILLMLGGFSFARFILMAVKSHQLSQRGIKAQGVITGFRRSEDDLIPLIRYRVGGRVYEIESHCIEPQHSETLPRGTRIPVIYDPREPHAGIRADGNYAMATGGWFLFGLFLFFTGAMLYMAMRSAPLQPR